MRGLPDFVVIGAMKSGTSSLHEQLAARSGIHMSDPKEPNFFSDDERYARGLDHYRACFRGAAEGQIVGESSTHYTKLPTFPASCERLYAALPGARLVYLVRDPVQRIVSQYVHEITRNEVRGPIDRVVLEQERFVAYSSYHRQLAPYLERFGRERVLVVASERLRAAPDAELARICRFLGDPSPEEPRWDASLGERNVGAVRLRDSALREGLLALPGVRRVVDRIPSGPREWLKGRWRVRRAALAAETRARLVAALDPDLAALGDALGRPLRCDHWSQQVADAPLDWPPGLSASPGTTRQGTTR